MNRRWVSLIIFAAGVGAVAVAFRTPAVREALLAVAQVGYPAAFFAGVLYGVSFTAPTATVLFASLAPIHPVLGALVGGAGAALYDLSVFSFVRHEARQGMLAAWRSRLNGPRLPRWLMVVIGAFILASPLPDELAAGTLGLTTLRGWQFVVLSFALNGFGIFFILVVT